MKQFFLQAKLAPARQCAFCETAKHSNARRFRAFILAEKVRDIRGESFLARWTAKTRHRQCCGNLRRIDSRGVLLHPNALRRGQSKANDYGGRSHELVIKFFAAHFLQKFYSGSHFMESAISTPVCELPDRFPQF